MSVMPSDQISTEYEYVPVSMASMTSGAIQYGEPMNVLVFSLSPNSLLIPKSAIRIYQRASGIEEGAPAGQDDPVQIGDYGAVPHNRQRSSGRRKYRHIEHS